MSYEIIILLLITLLFFIFLILKKVTNIKSCALCAATVITWLSLLVAYWLDIWVDELLLAVLMGGSAVGLLYLMEKSLPEKFHLFRLPFYLTLVTVIVISLGRQIGIKEIMFLGILWLVFYLVYLLRTKPKIKGLADRIVACCRDW